MTLPPGHLHHLGQTRSRRAQDHLLQTPDTFVAAPLPGMVEATAIVHAAPALGAAFTQYTAVLQPGGQLGPTAHSRFVYVLQGAATIETDSTTQTLGEGGFACLPSNTRHTVRTGEGTHLAVIEKPYVAEAFTDPPTALFGKEQDIGGTPLPGNDGIQVRTLLGTDPRFDFAVNTMEYAPGARLGMVEVHVMEHGLLLLEGEGIYRLGDAWYPVTAGDFIWMGPFCPQWFGALGSTPARYLIYKDWNRHPLAGNGLESRFG